MNLFFSELVQQAELGLTSAQGKESQGETLVEQQTNKDRVAATLKDELVKCNKNVTNKSKSSLVLYQNAQIQDW